MLSRLYTKLVSAFLFPLHEKLKKHDTIAINKQLERSQWQSTEQIIAQRDQRLTHFIEQAVNQVPYYRQLFQSLNLTPASITSANDLHKLPFLDKDIIRQHFDDITSNEAQNVKPFTTGGSSGTPLTFLLSNERVSHDVAEKLRATRWWDVDIGDKEIVAWGSPIELGAQDKVRLIRDYLFRSLLIPAFDMNDEKILGFINKIKQEKPKMLFGYPSVYTLIANTAKKHGIDLTTLGIKVVFVTSERLYPYQREAIEQAFSAPVANGYGGRDAGFIAHECPKGNMHISAEDIVVEIIDAQGKVLPDGESGEIVVTHMATSDFPFIRYRTGDIGTIATSSCACGRGLPVLKDIEGRTTDFVIAEDGTVMHGLALIYILREIPEVEAFKIVQESLSLTQIFIVAPQLSSELESHIVQRFKQRLGENVIIDVQQVERIEAEKSGKFRYVISKVEVS